MSKKVKNKINEFEIDKLVDNVRLYNKYKLLALNMFKWINLPKGITSDHIEKVLYQYGQGVLFKDDKIGFMFLQSSGTGTPNILGEDVYCQVSGFGYSKIVKLYDTITPTLNLQSDFIGIRCKNNDIMQPSILDVIDYTNKMNEVEKAIDYNLRQQKFPYLIFTNSNNEFSMKTLMDKVEKGEPVIYPDKRVSMDDFQFFNTGVPFIIDKLQDYKKDLNQEILNYYGLSATNNKRERMLVDELNNNNDYKDRHVELMYKQRKLFCDMVNEYYNINMDVICLNNEKYDNEISEGSEING